ncbi:MAG: type I restriction enzyme HsdR N-terminal domain-containing protein [Prevotellaceae bacterium]|jgi:hypothetical protein|nr:type I restriction enzyme HsdR N-terminal domain-containing protein [Prevotellaceae bacterium]
MQKLNLPEYEHRMRKYNNVLEIFDPVRCKFVALTPEEWVRQNFVRYLLEDKNTPQKLMRVEASLTLNGMQRRSDVVVYNRNGLALMAVECKAATVKITQDIFDQLTRYNLVLQVSYLVVTNGLQHYCCKVDFTAQSYTFLNEIPDYKQITGSLGV